MFYSDKTNCDSRGKTDRHPLFLTLGNIPIKKRNFPNAKALIGFLPILKAQNESEKKSNLFHLKIRQLFHQCLDTILEPLVQKYQTGVYLKINGKSEHVFLFPTLVLSDWLEAAEYCCTSKSTNAQHPCHACLIEKDQLNNINLSDNDIVICSHDNMKLAVQNGTENDFSIARVTNSFWKHQ